MKNVLILLAISVFLIFATPVIADIRVDKQYTATDATATAITTNDKDITTDDNAIIDPGIMAAANDGIPGDWIHNATTHVNCSRHKGSFHLEYG